nr:hypothetical protein [Tanacetum cinerariifolium]
LSATSSTIPPPAADEASEREEVDDFCFLAWSRPIGRTYRTSTSKPTASLFKFKPPYAEPEVVSEVLAFLLTVFCFSRKMMASQLISKQDGLSKFANTTPMKSRDHTQLYIPHKLFDT